MIRALYWTAWGLSFLPRMLLSRHGWRLEGVGHMLGKGLRVLPNLSPFLIPHHIRDL
jgi:hypothetical protein